MEKVDTIRSNSNYWLAVRVVHLIVATVFVGLGIMLIRNPNINIKMPYLLSIALLLLGIGVFGWHLVLLMKERKMI